MERKVKVAAIQMSCSRDITENIEKADRLVREAHINGAKIILLPELFERQYFCQERRYETHIPDDHYYQEKFYFTPGDSGFKVWDTKYAKIGVGICWDQWFPEAARSMALMGAEILFYPTAIGSEPILECDSMEHWRRTMQGHAAANIIPVVAANRYGLEEVYPCVENGNQNSSLNFYGSSFITDELGEIIESAGRDKEEILYSEIDLDKNREDRLAWGLFRDRRPKMYNKIVE